MGEKACEQANCTASCTCKSMACSVHTSVQRTNFDPQTFVGVVSIGRGNVVGGHYNDGQSSVQRRVAILPISWRRKKEWLASSCVQQVDRWAGGASVLVCTGISMNHRTPMDVAKVLIDEEEEVKTKGIVMFEGTR
ncbi:hypothetical protein CAPTEDRAFT_189964 [Capitella teleta]|uniref:Uncharacterized protein n=1 Tax=Capitella teleta TaxID=283909 RepID=R7U528_CAPTE|nr:hypothetical protein CAPTEDRAFT_189964 [Capitella teleta]|eukprot:ELT98260.1 hypothetical protein CAPTEDRAFT_189964 [Capitella teleta]